MSVVINVSTVRAPLSKNILFFIFYLIFELKFPHKKKEKKQIETADNRAAATVCTLEGVKIKKIPSIQLKIHF